MPQFKQPSTLQKMAIQALGRTVSQRAAIAPGMYLNIRDLHEYMYGELPDVLSQEVTAHMLAEVAGTLTTEDKFTTHVSFIAKCVLVATVCHRSRILDLSNAPSYAIETLSGILQTFTKLHTLIFPDRSCPGHVAKTLADGPSSFKSLVRLRMRSVCTDDLLYTLASCCYATLQDIDVKYSYHVTDASFKILLKCRKFTHISIFGTKMTSEGFVDFLRHKMTDGTAEGILGLSVDQERNSGRTSVTQLYLIAVCCPMLKQLEARATGVDMERLISLTRLESLALYNGHFTEGNFDSFLRVRGSNITSLELQYVRSLDLTFVLNHCVNVRTLSVTGDIIMEKFKHAPNTCQDLEVLKISGIFPPLSIEGMLCACVNLTSLFLRHCKEGITDELILRVLSKNPLQKLTRFGADCDKMTMRCVDAVVEHCPLLEELRLLECRVITDEQVKMLRQKIKSRNEDLRIDFTSYPEDGFFFDEM